MNWNLVRERLPKYLLRAVCAAGLLAFFIKFAGPALHAGFNVDDPMNIYYYWSQGAGKLVTSLFVFFTDYSRPMGGVYFGTLYHFFGLDPFPYHVALTGLLLVNMFLAYRFGHLLIGSEWAGALTALGVAYHARMPHLAYLPAFVFDVLCFTFYFLALTYYLGIRQRGERLNKRQTAIFLALLVCTLDSKEMAVSLAVMVLLYEIIWHGRKAQPWPALLGGVLTAVFILGKSLGADALIRTPGYTPVFTWNQYSNKMYEYAMTILLHPLPTLTILLLGIVVLLAAIIGRRKDLLWLWCFVWIAPLPVVFLPGRGLAVFYLPLAGWAAAAAALILWPWDAIIRRLPWKWAPVLTLLLVFFVGRAYWRETKRESRYLPPAMGTLDHLAVRIWKQMQVVQPRVKPNSTIYVADDPFDGWDMSFIVELAYHDRTVKVWLGRKTPLPPADIARMDYIFTVENGEFRTLKRP